jgi:hypothetical protein
MTERLRDKVVFKVAKPSKSGAGDSSVADERFTDGANSTEGLIFDADGKLVSRPRVRPEPGKPRAPKRPG